MISAFSTRPSSRLYQILLVQFGETEHHWLAMQAAQRADRLNLDAAQQEEWATRSARIQRDFSVPRDVPPPVPTVATVTLRELRDFLYLPAKASLRRHLHVDDEDEQTLDDDEPLVTGQQVASALVRQTIHRLILAASRSGAEEALAHWEDQFTATFADARLRCQAPEAAFGEIDQVALLEELRERIHGQGQIGGRF